MLSAPENSEVFPCVPAKRQERISQGLQRAIKLKSKGDVINVIKLSNKLPLLLERAGMRRIKTKANTLF
jgi:hypothetical protein